MKEFIDKLNKSLNHLLNNFGEHCEEWGSDQEGECRGKSCSDCVLKHAIEIINELAEEYECEDKTDYANIELYAFWQKHQWIPCSKRLPEAKKEVLIFADDNSIYVGRLLDDGFSVYDGEGWIALKHIIAWQPLPEPYQAPATEKTHKK